MKLSAAEGSLVTTQLWSPENEMFLQSSRIKTFALTEHSWCGVRKHLALPVTIHVRATWEESSV